MTRTTNISWKKITKSLKSPFKPSKKDKVKPKTSNGLILQTEDQSEKMIKDWKTLLAEISSKGEIPDSFIDRDNFPRSFKSLDNEMGFGQISSEKENVEAKIVLQGKNPFMDNNDGVLSPAFGDFLPYSQIYNVNSEKTNNQTYFIVRHYLNTESLSEAELGDIHVASSDSGEIFSVENLEDVKTSRKSSVTTGGSRVSGSKLLGQMESLVRGSSSSSSSSSSPAPGSVGAILLTVHKANSIEKKGLVGKADPYVVLQLGDQKLKSGTVDNNHDPVWHFTGQFTVFDKDENIKISVFDEDIGKDDFLGETSVSVEELRRSGEMTNKVLKLEHCKSGQLSLSAKFVPLEEMKKTKGKLSLIVHSGKKLEKKNKLKKADPYLVLKVGEETFKSATVNNNNSPVWEFKVELDYKETSPRQASIEVFDDDIGKDAPIGNVTVDIHEVVKSAKIEQIYKLANCKTGELMISAFFSPTDVAVVTEETAAVTKTTQIQSRPPPAGSFPGLKFSKPVYIGEEFAVVDRNSVSNWFLIASPHQSLPINVSIVPYRRPSQPDSPLRLYCLPAGSFHAVRRVVHSGQGLRKSGFQSHCVLMAGRKCQVYTKDNNEACGEILPYTWGRDLHDALVQKSGQQDFLDLLIKDSETGKLLTTLTLSFYHDSVDAA